MANAKVKHEKSTNSFSIDSTDSKVNQEKSINTYNISLADGKVNQEIQYISLASTYPTLKSLGSQQICQDSG